MGFQHLLHSLDGLSEVYIDVGGIMGPQHTPTPPNSSEHLGFGQMGRILEILVQ